MLQDVLWELLDIEAVRGGVEVAVGAVDQSDTVLVAFKVEGRPGERDVVHADGELAVDVYQTPDDLIIKTMVAGVRPDDLDLSITRDMVTIKGKREESHEVENEDFFHKELYWGSFSRTVLLPQEIDVEASEASEKHGLLIIKLPKIDKDRQTKLKVRSN